MIIDAHMHIAQYICGFTSRGELRSIGEGRAQYATGEVVQMFPSEMGDMGVSPESLLKVMDSNDVEKAVLLQGNYLGFQNEYTYEAVNKYPNRFIGAATYDPYCVKVEEIRRHLFDDLNFKIVKFELSNGSGLMANHLPFYLDGHVMNECFKDAEKRGLIVVLDVGRPHNCCWQIDAIVNAVSKYPKINFVFCHLLAPQREDVFMLREVLPKFRLSNIYFDISSLASNQKPETYPYPTAITHLESAKEIIGADRLMYGSDSPMNLTRDSYPNLKNYISESGIFSDSELKDIFYNTAQKIYFDKH